ncbi:NAD-dependent epimerase/dehydratase family protein [Bacillus cereus]|uniref:NAD-dependent epimerase/dehydratase family protein n=1 Tax=Bacillus cereus TaxID=1396 RepID=UPI0010BD0D41|nr:NAD-dependent epimerase/dehydratase family protein [Bacillus cereus]TKI36303.1 NAD-dependent epimerase/dehydratase family protein [Bacillus cereus]
MTTKIMITGGFGFIGTQLIKKLLASGEDIKLYIIDNLSTGSHSECLLNDVHFFLGDIRDEDSSKYIEEVAPDYLIHLAAQKNVINSFGNTVDDTDINIIGTLKIMDACRNLPNFRNFIFASSASVYGDNKDIPIKEDAIKMPISPYGKSKMLIEECLNLYQELYQFPFVTLRFANVYGIKSTGGKDVISIFYDKLAEGTAPCIFGDGHQTRDYVYVDDIVCAINLAMNVNNNESFNIATNKKTTVHQVLNYLNKIMGTHIEPEMSSGRLCEIQDSLLSNEKFLFKTGWSPKYNLIEGITQMHKLKIDLVKKDVFE